MLIKDYFLSTNHHSNQDIQMYAGLAEILLTLFFIFFCLSPQHLLVSFWIVSTQLEDLNVRRRKRVHILMNQ